MELDEFRSSLDAWLDANADALAPYYEGFGTLAEHLGQLAKVKRLAYDADFARYGWPERVGGLGGSALLRAYLGEALNARGLVDPGAYSMTEVLAPTMIDFADPALAAEMVPRLLRGEETWCQGFSEPSTGSNLAALACRAAAVDGGYVVNGQKVWTSFAHHAQRCVLLTRTGTPESAHKGITAFFVDVDSPGVTVRPFETMHGLDEFAEVFFDDVFVPVSRRLGDEGQGWSVAMDLLPYERSTALWHRGAFLQRRLDELAAVDGVDPARLGEVAQMVFAFRARSRGTQYRLHEGGRLGAETSIDKILLATTEQAVFDLALDTLGESILFGDDTASEEWRSEFLYSRAATIYGGSAEIQRNIVARRLLDLGPDR